MAPWTPPAGDAFNASRFAAPAERPGTRRRRRKRALFGRSKTMPMSCRPTLRLSVRSTSPMTRANAREIVADDVRLNAETRFTSLPQGRHATLPLFQTVKTTGP